MYFLSQPKPITYQQLDLNAALVDCWSFQLPHQAARGAARELVEQYEVDGLVCVNDIVLLGARAGVRELGPEALLRTRLAFRTGTNIVDYLGTPAAAAYYSRSDAGWHLADILLDAIDGVEVTRLQQVVQCTLRDFEGDSAHA